MATPFTSRTTISSRNKMAQFENGNSQEILASINNNRVRASMQAPSQIARNRALPAPPSAATQRLANLANGFSSALKDRKSDAIKQTPTFAASVAMTPKTDMRARSPSQTHTTKHHKASFQPVTTRLPPHTAARVGKQPMKDLRPPLPPPSTSSRIIAPSSRLTNPAPLNSRSSSVVSSSSSATASKRPSVSTIPAETNYNRQQGVTANNIPDTNLVRKGLAKFSNPIECQRIFQTLSLKVRQKDEVVEAREKEVDKLQEQLKYAVNIGAGYATVVQYFAVKLRLDSDKDLLKEHEELKCRVNELMVNEKEYESKLESILIDYKSHLKVEQDLRNNLEQELQETRDLNTQNIKDLKDAHKNELNDLNENHLAVEGELENKINILNADLELKNKELSDLRKEHEILSNNYNRLEESLTKDKDARVKYLQEKINQLQKDVESLNSVLEMRQERVHALEKDSLLLADAQNDLMNQKDINKALNQQLESFGAALEKKREQYDKLIAEHEKIRQELHKERKERRRMTMRTEQLEYVLNESCASESDIDIFNSTVRDIDSAS